MALLISFFTGVFSDIITKHNNFSDYLFNINHISLGLNKGYIDELFGLPSYQSYDSNTSLSDCIYVLENCLIKTYYKDNALVGFFITTLDLNKKNKISLGGYDHLVSNKTLGHFSYYEIEGKPSTVENFVTM